MDYRKILRDALSSCEITKSYKYECEVNDIIDVNFHKYLVLHKYGKFHKVLNLEDSYEQLIKLENKNYVVVIPNKLKKEITEYQKPELDIERYYRKNYLYSNIR